MFCMQEAWVNSPILHSPLNTDSSNLPAQNWERTLDHQLCDSLSHIHTNTHNKHDRTIKHSENAVTNVLNTFTKFYLKTTLNIYYQLECFILLVT